MGVLNSKRGNCAFSVASKLCDQLPLYIRQADSLPVFKIFKKYTLLSLLTLEEVLPFITALYCTLLSLFELFLLVSAFMVLTCVQHFTLIFKVLYKQVD